MKKIIFFLAVLALSIWLGLKIHQDPGYVILNYGHWRVETTLWFSILAMIFVFLLLHILWRALNSVASISGNVKRWSGGRRQHSARAITARGLCQLAEGQWRQAERSVIKGAEYSEVPLLNYLAAATAAQHQGEYQKRNHYLRNAHETTPKAQVAIELTQAQLQFSSKQFEQALATLRHLQQLVPHHRHVLKLLHQVYLELHDWQNLKILLPELRKRKVLKSPELTSMERLIYSKLLAHAIKNNNLDAINDVWHDMPRHLQNNHEFIGIYSDYLLTQQQYDTVEKLIQQTLKKKWNSALVYRYGLIHSTNETKQLTTAENWLKEHKHDPNLLLTLGRICARNRLWGKAQRYFESSIALQPQAETYQELGKILEQTGALSDALLAYKQALKSPSKKQCSSIPSKVPV